MNQTSSVVPLSWDTVRQRAGVVHSVYKEARKRPNAPTVHLDSLWRRLAHHVVAEPPACSARGCSAVETTRAMERVIAALDDGLAEFTRLRNLPDNQLSAARSQLAPSHQPLAPPPDASRAASDLLARLRARGVQLEVDSQGRIVLRPPYGVTIANQDRVLLQTLKKELIAQITTQSGIEIID